MLSILIFLPLIGLLILALVPAQKESLIRGITLGTALVQAAYFFALVLPAWWGSDAVDAYGLTEKLEWFSFELSGGRMLSIHYLLGADGMSMALIAMSMIIQIIAVMASAHIRERVKTYHTLLLLLFTSVTGSFLALDFFLFYLFFEFMLLPMFFLIGIWGGPKKEFAAIKFFLYTLFGSVFMLLVMAAIAMSYSDAAGTMTLSQPVVAATEAVASGNILAPDAEIFGISARTLAFFIMLISFAIKLPSVPVHTWLPDAHVQAPTAVSVLLAAILLKVGGYGLIRWCASLFPDQMIEYNWIFALAGVISIVYAGAVALAQKDLKRMIAYSSVSHMGFVMLGIASLSTAGMKGAVFQMVSHGLISAMLFLLAGMVQHRYHDRTIVRFSGLWQKLPQLTFFFIIAFFASLGLPGFSAFVAEVMVLFGAVGSCSEPEGISFWYAILAIPGILISAGYYLRAMKIMFFGEYAAPGDAIPADISLSEKLQLAVPSILILIMGLYPASYFALEEAVAGAGVAELTEKILITGKALLP